MDGLTGIEKLKALQEIALLKARRDRAADIKDWELYESIHAPDHVSENGDYGRWTSAAEMIVNVRKSMENLTPCTIRTRLRSLSKLRIKRRGYGQ
jgi:hypothetical protein